jgi:hypothetical protein
MYKVASSPPLHSSIYVEWMGKWLITGNVVVQPIFAWKSDLGNASTMMMGN